LPTGKHNEGQNDDHQDDIRGGNGGNAQLGNMM
jgi:hypothetical protein